MVPLPSNDFISGEGWTCNRDGFTKGLGQSVCVYVSVLTHTVTPMKYIFIFNTIVFSCAPVLAYDLGDGTLVLVGVRIVTGSTWPDRRWLAGGLIESLHSENILRTELGQICRGNRLINANQSSSHSASGVTSFGWFGRRVSVEGKETHSLYNRWSCLLIALPWIIYENKLLTLRRARQKWHSLLGFILQAARSFKTMIEHFVSNFVFFNFK